MPSPPDRKAWLVLEDETVVEGIAFGAPGTAYGELVFNTGMTGYQESLTDPSYHGQVLMFTYPMIGNYGVNPDDWESDKVWPRAVVVREWCREPSHRQMDRTLNDWLTEQGVPGIAGIDTRALTLKTREKGCLRCFVTDDESQVEQLRQKVAAMPSVEAENLAGQASTEIVQRYAHNADGRLEHTDAPFDASAPVVAVIDTGIKRNILRNLAKRFHVVRMPWNASAKDIEAVGAHALFIANGPGDPGHPDILAHTVPAVRAASERLPTFGICYGNQLVARAYGATTHKMKFGHRGANIPVRDEGTPKVRITSQNHGFAVAAESVPGTGLRIWQRCPNDGTVEALMHETLPVFTTQYHPEATPGPQDSGHYFDTFRRLVDDCRSGKFRPGHFVTGGGH
jgi:carbamoyl-phosphate synthase small subunit